MELQWMTKARGEGRQRGVRQHRRAVLLVVILAALGLVGCGDDGVEVPDVEGRSAEVAQAHLEGAGFEVELSEAESDLPAGTVASQRPSSGEKVAEGDTVELVIATASAQTLTGELTIRTATYFPDPPASCIGTRGYSDIREGTQVRVLDGEGDLLATGKLERGEPGSGHYSCIFAFTVDDVPASDFYTVEVSHRDGLSYSHAELEDKNWTVELSLS